jgi:uncharacterized protein
VTKVVRRAVLIRRPVDDVFAFHGDAANLDRVLPGGAMRVVGETRLARDRVLDVVVGIPPVRARGSLVVREWDPPHFFLDAQYEGPFALWEHRHRFEPRPGATWMEDEITFALPPTRLRWERPLELGVRAFLAAKLARTKRALEG